MEWALTETRTSSPMCTPKHYNWFCVLKTPLQVLKCVREAERRIVEQHLDKEYDTAPLSITTGFSH